MTKTLKTLPNARNTGLACFFACALLFPCICHGNTPTTQTPTSISIPFQQFQQLKNNNDKLATELDVCRTELMKLKTHSPNLVKQLNECRTLLNQCKQQLDNAHNQLTLSNAELTNVKTLLKTTEQSLATLKKQIELERKQAIKTQRRLQLQGYLKAFCGCFVGYIVRKL